MRAGLSFLRTRALWVAIFALVALVVRLRLPAPPPRSVEGVAAMLGAAAGGEVGADDFVWEERGGFLHDAFLGRRLLFLARRPASGATEPMGDLFRARVRLTRSGRPINVGPLYNLTESPLGDERELVAQGHYAAFVTMAYGAVQGITLLDLAGDAPVREARTRSEQILASIENWLETGSLRGIGRSEITFATPPDEAREELSTGSLVMALGKEAVPAALDLQSFALNTGPRNVFDAQAQRIPHPVRPASDTLSELARELGGDLPARATHTIVTRLESLRRPVKAAPLEIFPGREVPSTAAPDGDFPPPPIAPLVSPPLPGEGLWAPPAAAFLPRPAIEASSEAKPQPYFYESAIRPDPGQPDALVRLVAIDMRQLDLSLEPGFDEPRAATGPTGAGRLPSARNPGESERVVAAFSAAPASGKRPRPTVAPGLVVRGRVLVPPVTGLASVALDRDGRPSLGSLPATEGLPQGTLALLQTPDPLVGEQPPLAPLLTESSPRKRSALCLLPSGHLVYAWGFRLNASTLASALRLVGCAYGVHLAAEPAPVGFAYLHASSEAPDGWESALLSSEMSISPTRLIHGSPNPFFYLTLRDPRPAPQPPDHKSRSGEESEPPSWSVDPGRQPTPPWIPSIFSATVPNLGAQVHLYAFSPERFAFRMRRGAKEPATKAVVALPSSLAEDEQARVLAAIGLGAGRRRGALGLSIDGAEGIAFRGKDMGVLSVDKNGKLRIERAPGEGERATGEGESATELPLTAEEGKLLPSARTVGSMRSRASACVLDDGTFLVAATTFDSHEATSVILVELGCSRVVALDRGSHLAAFVHRKDADPPIEASYDATVLYAVDLPMRGRATPL